MIRMKSTALSTLGILLLAGSAARADLDLTPTTTVQMMEQVPMLRVVFHDGGKEIVYQPPKGWTVSGSHTSAALSIPQHPQARALIQVAPRLRIPAFDDKAEKLFQTNPGLLQLPKGALNVKLVEVDLNPLVIDSHKTLEVQLTYSFFGQSCAKSILLVDRNGSEVSFTLDTMASDFKMLHQMFRGSLFSMENL
jgi:hypothetical protein